MPKKTNKKNLEIRQIKNNMARQSLCNQPQPDQLFLSSLEL